MARPSTLPPPVRGTWYPMTFEEFLDWSPDEGQAEWVDGEGIAYASNSARHVDTVLFLSELLRICLRISGLGRLFADQMLVRLIERPSGRMPDVFVVGRADQGRIRPQWFDGPPLLVVEVISEDSVERDLVTKRDEYERAGVPEYVTVEARPGRRGVIWLRLDSAGHYRPIAPDSGGRLRSASLPGFWLDPGWLDQDPLPDPERLMLRIAPAAYRRHLEGILAEPPE